MCSLMYLEMTVEKIVNDWRHWLGILVLSEKKEWSETEDFESDPAGISLEKQMLLMVKEPSSSESEPEHP